MLRRKNNYMVNILGVEFELGFKPHKFQQSLAMNSCLQHNNIISIRTGSGKTLIAALLTRFWYEKYSKENNLNSFKVFFVVPTRNLVTQQFAAFQKAFTIADLIPITENINSSKILNYFNMGKKIFFLTPQKLINFLNETQFKFDQISILILDECHHTYDSHPYNELMKIYYKSLGEMNKKPLIVGLTASFGVGRELPIDHLISLCANMDCQLVSTLTKQDDIDDLEANIPSPLNDIIIPTGSCPELDELKSTINLVCVQLANLVKIDIFSKKLGHSEFDQFIHDTEIKASTLNDQDLSVVTKYLYELNLFYQRCDDFPLDYCFEKLNNNLYNSKATDPSNITILCQNLTKKINKLFEFKSFVHPKLIALEKSILKYHSNDSRGLVLVRTRNHTKALTEYLNQSIALRNKGIMSNSLVGLGCVDGISMNQNQQNNVIKEFLTGAFNVLVSTDIAQEGLDIPTCNYVIRYEFVSNEIGTVQSRGRARAENGQCILITSSGSLNEKREFENKINEKIMHKTICDLNKMEKDKFKEKFELKQKIILESLEKNYDQVLPLKVDNLLSSNQVDVYCRECGVLLFNCLDLRYREPSYYCICTNFIFNLITFDTDQLLFYCATKSCGRELGRTVCLRSSPKLYMINIKSVKFKFPGKSMKIFSKWSKLTELVSIQNINS